MRITALVENTRIPQRKDLQTEPGLSLLIEMDGRQILFDTGLKDGFYANAQNLKVDISKIDLAVISHHHFDHGGGLATFLKANDHAKIYLKKSRTEDFYLHIFGIIRRKIGLDVTLFQKYPQRFSFLDEFSEIVPGVFIVTKIDKIHHTPKGNRHLFKAEGNSRILDDFEHEAILVIRQEAGLVVFNGCSHNGILNMLDSVVAHFPGKPIKAVIGGFHLVDLPPFNTLAGSEAEVQELGRDMLKYPIEKIHTCHCTGLKAYKILREVMGAKLEYIAAGCQVEL